MTIFFVFRKIGTYLPTATTAEIGQKSICNHLCDWSRASPGWPLPCLDTNVRGCSKNRHMQSEIKRFCVLSPQQWVLGHGKHRQSYYIHAERSSGGKEPG